MSCVRQCRNKRNFCFPNPLRVVLLVVFGGVQLPFPPRLNILLTSTLQVPSVKNLDFIKLPMPDNMWHYFTYTTVSKHLEELFTFNLKLFESSYALICNLTMQEDIAAGQ
jgi:hypothetical protein